MAWSDMHLLGLTKVMRGLSVDGSSAFEYSQEWNIQSYARAAVVVGKGF